MPRRLLRLTAPDGTEIEAALAELRRQLKVAVDFPDEVVAEAKRAARSVELPETDETAIPFVTIDPPGSMDLDQALHVERRGSGYRVRYAIADVADFVAPGGPLDEEAHRRGETLYAPDGNALLYPSELSQRAASLLPGELRPALVWTMEVDETGEGTAVHVRKARVRSRAKLDYGRVQQALDDGSADEILRLLREVGILRQQREVRRGGVSLQLPEQEVAKGPDGYALSYRAPLPVEGWNAQISLMTGMAAAELMLTGEVGILRTVPAADPARLERFRRTAKALGVTWPQAMSYPDFVRALDANVPRQAALLAQAAGLLRGSGYTAFDQKVPEARRARRARLHVRAHHGAAPPARRSLRRRDVHRALGRKEGAGVGRVRAAAPARGDGARRSQGGPVRIGDRVGARGGDPRGKRREDVRGGRDRGRLPR